MKQRFSGRALPFALTALALATTVAFAAPQTATVAFESFDFGPVGTLLGSHGSGAGWVSNWNAGANDDNGQLAAPSFDNVGLRVHLNRSVAPSFRDLDIGQHPDIAEAGRYGRDNATVWIRFQIQEVTQSTAGAYFGGLSLFDGGTEEFFVGSPWGSLAWGLDDHNGGLHNVAGTNIFAQTTLVTRIDFLSGDEHVRLWVNPASPHPQGPADVDILVPNFRFDRIRIDNAGGSGGEAARFDLDAITIEKAVPPLGTNYCSANANSTGVPARMSATGTAIVAQNDLVLHCADMPANAFGFFLNSPAAGFVMNPGGSSGNLCLSGSIGRYVGPGQVQNSGAGGAIALLVNLLQHPTPTGFVQVLPNGTWRFTCWFRDVSGGSVTSNFADGLEITFL